MEDASSPRRIIVPVPAPAPEHRFSVNGLDSRTREEQQHQETQQQQQQPETRRGTFLSSPLLSSSCVGQLIVCAELKDSN